jgi:hypothetical protein
MSEQEFAKLVAEVDEVLDEGVSAIYKRQPLAQHWARVAKAGEEAGEAVDALIAWTGQNPRKAQRDEAYDELLDELADTALTGIYAMQHFTKDADETMRRLHSRLALHHSRLLAGSVAGGSGEETNG